MTRITDVTWRDRILGVFGLFLIGLIGAVVDRIGTLRSSAEAVQRHVPQR